MLTLSGYAVSDAVHEDAESILLHARRGDQGVLLRTPRVDYPSPEQIGRLRYGYEIQRGLAQAGVVRVLGLERRTGGWVVVLEDFGGRSLRGLLDERSIGVPEALTIALGITTALAELHAEGIVHKNVCPTSVLVAEGGAVVKLDDFGIASRLDQENPTITSPSRIEGSLPYISPEQTGRMNRRVDYRTDFYSLGATLYELLTGRPPFVSDEPMAVIHGHIAVRPTPPHELSPAVPPSASAVVMKLLAKNAEERYQSTYGLLADLRECLTRAQADDGEMVPGRHDVSAVFQIAQKLYGRERENAALVAAFERAALGTAELLLVAGYSGIGKSSLVNEIHKPIVARRGHFAAGKFDQLQNVPYSAFIQAFQSLLRQLLAERPEHVAAWRQRFRDELGDGGQVIADVIPELSLIMGGLSPVPALGPREAEHRFNLVFLQFLGVVATAEHPLALFLDDLHWADTSSLRLIENILRDPKGKSLLIIGAYRDNEVHAAHPLVLTLADLRRAGTAAAEIVLRPLAQGDVARLVADALGFADTAPAAELAALIFEKTQGNPFFVIEFLKSLHQRGLVAFDPAEGRFAWSLPRIHGEAITDNVAHLMADKIRRMPAATQATLRLAACIGNTFDLATLAVVRAAPSNVVAAELWEAMRQGLVHPVGHGYRYFDAQGEDDSAWSWRGDTPVAYAFAHDRVQEAALAQIPADERKAVHRRIGQLLLDSTPEAQLDGRLFDIVNQLDLAAALITEPGEQVACARLNLQAARKAKDSTAYGPALRYLGVAITLLGDRGWETERPLVMELFKQRAECEHLTGRFTESEATFERLLRESRTRAEKVAIHKLEIGLLTASGKFAATWRLTREALKLYGVDVPEGEALREATRVDLAHLRDALDGPGIRRLLDLPAATDEDAQERILLLSRGIAFGAYMFPDLYAYEATMVVTLSMRHGNANGSGLGYMGLGLVMASAFADGTRALALAEVGVAVAERRGDPLERVLTSYWLAGFVAPWGQHLRKSLPILRETYAGALKAGALHYVGLSALQMVLSAATAGEPLADIHEQATRFTELQIRGGRPDMAAFIATFLRYALLLRRGEIPADASAWHDEDFLVQKLTHYHAARATFRIMSLHASLVLDEGERTDALADLAERELGYLPGHQQISLYHLARVVLGARRVPALPAEERPAALAALEPHRARLAAWAEHCPENFLHLALLTEAEIAAARGEADRAAPLYDRAVQAAAQHEYVQHEALACELSARFHLARGRRGIAAGYLLDARDAYARWGADAKVARLAARYPELYGGDAPGEGALDLGSVLRASQAISGEIVLADLLRKLMSTALENAGAQRGLLLLGVEGGVVVEAENVAAGADQVVVHPAGVDLTDRLSAGVVRYVERTGESVVLSDAQTAPLFQSDAYVQRKKPRSVLCMPVRQKNARVGTLYLENNLVSGAFTPARCRVLELLASQAAISLENALLYDTLDRRVKERTGELSQTNQELSRTISRLQETQRQLIAQERLASLGALTAGIAHEIKNPLQFVINFAKLSIDLADQLDGSLAGSRARLDEDTRLDVDEILGDLRLNMGKIASHGERANQIINGMLLHSREGVGVRQEVDLNSLLSQSVSLAYHGLRAKDASFDATLEADYDPEVGLVELSATDMRRLFINLVNNACYAMAEKKRRLGAAYAPAIRVRTRSLGERVEVSLRDNGTGIPPAVVARIFDPFFTTKPPGEGTGLGLSISHDIVHGHHGEIRVDTVMGDHTELIITIPRRAPS
jgi:predicted ATPase/signal transduction histidine kinase